MNKWKDLSNRQSDQGSIFDNVRMLDEISVGCKSNDDDIASVYKNPAPGYEHLNNFHDSLAAIHFEGNENNSIYEIDDSKRSEFGDYSNKSILPEEDQEQLEGEYDNEEDIDDSFHNSENQDKAEEEDILEDEDFEIEMES